MYVASFYSFRNIGKNRFVLNRYQNRPNKSPSSDSRQWNFCRQMLDNTRTVDGYSTKHTYNGKGILLCHQDLQHIHSPVAGSVINDGGGELGGPSPP